VGPTSAPHDRSHHGQRTRNSDGWRGSPTAVSKISPLRKQQLDDWLDSALADTFPASDPIASPPGETLEEGRSRQPPEPARRIS
jgi:hypothetical protein